MSNRRAYHPSDTHLALHPPSELKTCRCEVRFAPRPISPDSDDDPDLCLSCNRKAWSRLWNGNRPIEIETNTAASDHPIVSIIDRRPRR